MFSIFSIPYTYKMYKILNNLKKQDENLIAKVNDIYFSFNYSDVNGSARNIDLTDKEKEELKLIKKDFPHIKMHFVMNASTVPNHFYMPEELEKLEEFIKMLHRDFQVEIITFNNTILLRSQYFRDLLNNLNITIKNSVNNMVDSLEKVKIFYEHFQIKDIILDRSLNRNEDELKKIIEYKKENNLTLTLLINEGCLPNCQYKQFCDNMITQYKDNTEEEINYLSTLHDQLTCTHDFQVNPSLALKSPFISPLYITYYKELGIDYFKIAGRGKEKWILENIINFYLKETGGTGNFGLRYFFSTYRPEIFQKITFNELEEFNFFENTKNCKLQCHSCDYCDNVFEKLKKII